MRETISSLFLFVGEAGLYSASVSLAHAFSFDLAGLIFRLIARRGRNSTIRVLSALQLLLTIERAVCCAVHS